jgi:hypothetical protein
MKIPKGIKFMFLLSVMLFLVGVLASNDVVAACATLIFVVLACTVEILEAIESKTNPETK